MCEKTKYSTFSALCEANDVCTPKEERHSDYEQVVQPVQVELQDGYEPKKQPDCRLTTTKQSEGCFLVSVFAQECTALASSDWKGQNSGNDKNVF